MIRYSPDNTTDTLALQDILAQLQSHADEMSGMIVKRHGVMTESGEEEYSFFAVQEIIDNIQMVLSEADTGSITTDILQTAKAVLHSLETASDVIPMPASVAAAIAGKNGEEFNDDIDEFKEELDVLLRDITSRLEGEIGDELVRVKNKMTELDGDWVAEVRRANMAPKKEELGDLKLRFLNTRSELEWNETCYIQCANNTEGAGLLDGIVPNIADLANGEPFNTMNVYYDQLTLEAENQTNPGVPMKVTAAKGTMSSVQTFIQTQYAAITRWHEALVELYRRFDLILEERSGLTSHSEDADRIAEEV